MDASFQLKRACLVILGLCSLVALHGRELELTGAYDDAGTTVTAAPGRSDKDVVSLHALLSMEFVPGLARRLHERTSHVKVKHTAGLLEVEVINREGEAGWQESWRQGKDYALRGDRVALHFRPGRFGQDQYVLLLETITSHRLLQVEVQRVKPTFFGPVYQPMGTYLFHRVE